MLEVRDLQGWREDKELFSSLAFELKEGSVLCVMGPNGSGKTTLLKILAGLYRVAEGTVLWKGRAISLEDPDFLNEVVYLGHQIGVRSGLTSLEYLSYSLSIAGGSLSKNSYPHLLQSLQTVGLKGFENVFSESLSRGQKQRLALARFLVQSGLLWLLDEPYNGLDKEGQALVTRMVCGHCKKGGMVVIVSHTFVDFPECSSQTLFLGDPH